MSSMKNYLPDYDAMAEILDNVAASRYEEIMRARGLQEDDSDEEDSSGSVLGYIVSRIFKKPRDQIMNTSCNNFCHVDDGAVVIEPFLDPDKNERNPWCKATPHKEFDSSRIWKISSFWSFLAYCVIAIAMWIAHILVVGLSSHVDDIIYDNGPCESVWVLTVGNLAGFTFPPFMLLLIRFMIFVRDELELSWNYLVNCIKFCFASENTTVRIQHPSTNLSIQVNLKPKVTSSFCFPLIKSNSPSPEISPIVKPVDFTSNSANINEIALEPKSNNFNNELKLTEENSNRVVSKEYSIPSNKAQSVYTSVAQNSNASSSSNSSSNPTSSSDDSNVVINDITSTNATVSSSANLSAIPPVNTTSQSFLLRLLELLNLDDPSEAESSFRKSVQWSVAVMVALVIIDIAAFTLWNLISPYLLSTSNSRACEQLLPAYYNLQVATTVLLYLCTGWLIFLWLFCQSLSFFTEQYTCFLSASQLKYREQKINSDKIDRSLAESKRNFELTPKILLSVPSNSAQRDFLELLCRLINDGYLPGLHLAQFSGLKATSKKPSITISPSEAVPFHERLLTVLTDFFSKNASPPAPAITNISTKIVSPNVAIHNSIVSLKNTEARSSAKNIMSSKMKVIVPTSSYLGVIKEDTAIDISSEDFVIKPEKSESVSSNGIFSKEYNSKVDPFVILGPDIIRLLWEFVGPYTLIQCSVVSKYWSLNIIPSIHKLLFNCLRTMTHASVSAPGRKSYHTQGPVIKVMTPVSTETFAGFEKHFNVATRARNESCLDLPLAMRKALILWESMFYSTTPRASSSVQELKLYDAISRRHVHIISVQLENLFGRNVQNPPSSNHECSDMVHRLFNKNQVKPSQRIYRILQESILSGDIIQGSISIGNSHPPSYAAGDSPRKQYGDHVRYLLDFFCVSKSCSYSSNMMLSSAANKLLLTCINNKNELFRSWAMSGYLSWKLFASDEELILSKEFGLEPDSLLAFCQHRLTCIFPSLLVAINDFPQYDFMDVLNMFILFWQQLFPNHSYRWRAR